MPLRLGFLCLLLAIASALAGDGIPPRGSAEEYPAHQTAGKVAIGAAYIPPVQVRKLFGEDLDKHGYVVFEVGVFPIDSKQANVSAGDFKLMQGKDTSTVRAATPHGVAADVWPEPPGQPWDEAGGIGGGGPRPTAGKRTVLERQLEEKSLPEVKTSKAAAGYIFFPKTSKDKRADYELLYFGLDGQISLKLSPPAKP